MKKFLSCTLALMLLTTMLLPGFALAEDDGVIGPYERYPETVIVNACNASPGDVFDDGFSENGNLYADLLLERSNIKVNLLWSVDDANYDAKLAACIASGDLPDIFRVKDPVTLKMLVDNDMIEDLTGTYEIKASDYTKMYYDSFGDEAWRSATFDGKLMAIPDLNYDYQFSGCWVRKDWLDKLSLEMPKTLEDVVNVAQAFVDNDMSGNNDTIGFVVHESVAGIYNRNFSMDSILNYFGAYPRSWVVDEEGNVQYGSVQPEYKEGLAFLADLYQRGLIDPQFAVRTTDDITALMLNGRCGITFSPWWMPDWPLGNAQVVDQQADWRAVLAPLNDDGKVHPVTGQISQNWQVVRKGYEHPEVVWELLNYDSCRANDADINAISARYDEMILDKEIMAPWRIVGCGLTQLRDGVRWEAENVKQGVESGDMTTLDPDLVNWATFIREYLYEGKLEYWGKYASRLDGSFVFTDDSQIGFQQVYYPSTTESMTLMWSNLEDLENEMMLKIIMGEESIDAFDRFVERWNTLGGKQITEEVNEAYKAANM